MKRRDLIGHLQRHGCQLLREGGNHSWWYNPQLHFKAAVPRHREISFKLSQVICQQLGIPAPTGSR